MMDSTMFRQIGRYRLTAHTVPLDGVFFPEILVSFDDGITLYGHRREMRFDTQLAAHLYARQWMGRCTVTPLGILESI
jgi:hypothetical protein